MLPLILSILCIIWVIYQAKIDAEHLNKNEFITDHTSRFISRILTGLMLACLNPLAGVLLLLIFWGLFDFMLNKFRGLSIWYIGGTAKTDNFFKKHSWLYFTTKILAVLSAITIYKSWENFSHLIGTLIF